MRKVKRKEHYPYELGDKIRFEKCGNEKEMEITDIIVETSVTSGTSKIRLELDGWYMLDTSLHEVKVQEKAAEIRKNCAQ